MSHVKDIARAMIDYTKNGNKFKTKQFKDYELKVNQRVRIEDLLQIFVDHPDMLKDFIKFIIEEFGETHPRELEKLT